MRRGSVSDGRGTSWRLGSASSIIPFQSMKQAKYLRDAEKRGEIDKEFNILTAEDEVCMTVKAGLRSVKQYGYTWQDIIDFSNGDREE